MREFSFSASAEWVVGALLVVVIVAAISSNAGPKGPRPIFFLTNSL